MKTLAIAIRDNLSTLLIGESGTGKTSAIRFLANQTKNGLRRVNLNGGTTADELVGRLLINDKGTYWVDGVLTEAMRTGDWIVLDEINAALPEVLFVLQSIMDDDGYLVLTEKDDKEIVYKHKNFRIFATCNPPEYAGTKEMNKALLSRFAICINAEFPPSEKELEIIEHHLGNAIASSEIAIKLVGLANETRKNKELGTSDYAINTRDILNTLKLTDLMDPLEALGLAFANKLETSDNKALKILAKLHLPLTKKKANAKRNKIKSTDEILIGKTFIFDNDMQSTYLGLMKDEEQFKEIIKYFHKAIMQNVKKDPMMEQLFEKLQTNFNIFN
jgi:cobaltochelatase CobS